MSKKKLIQLACWLIPMLVKSQAILFDTVFIANPHFYSEKVVNAHKINDSIYDFIVSTDSFLPNSYTDTKIEIDHINLNTKIITKKNIPLYNSSFYFINNSCRDKNGILLIAGTYFPNADSPKAVAFLKKMNKNYTTLFEKEYAHAPISDPVANRLGIQVPIITFENKYVLVCNNWLNLGRSIFLALETDTLGNELSRTEFNTPTKYDDPTCGIQTADSGFLYGGKTLYHDSFPQGLYSGILFKADKNQHQQWMRLFASNRDSNQVLYAESWINAVLEDTDGYVVAGSRHAKPGPYWAPTVSGNYQSYQQAWLAKLRKDNGEIIWERDLGEDTLWERQVATSVIKTNNGGYVLSGYRTTGIGGNLSSFIFKVNHHGDSLCYQYYDHFKDSLNAELTQVFQIQNNQYLAFGVCEGNANYHRYTNYTPWILEADLGLCGDPPPPVDTLCPLEVYPNPASGSLTVALCYPTLQTDSSAQIYLYDVLGQLVQEEFAPSIHKHILHLNPLATGMYILTVVHHKKRLSKKIIIEN